VETVKEAEPAYGIYIKEDIPLNSSDRKAYEYLGTDESKVKELKKTDPALDNKIVILCAGTFSTYVPLARL
jgi:CRISPR-associated protein Csd2